MDCFHKLNGYWLVTHILGRRVSMRQSPAKLPDNFRYLLHLYYFCLSTVKSIFAKPELFIRHNSTNKLPVYMKTWSTIHHRPRSLHSLIIMSQIGRAHV